MFAVDDGVDAERALLRPPAAHGVVAGVLRVGHAGREAPAGAGQDELPPGRRPQQRDDLAGLLDEEAPQRRPAERDEVLVHEPELLLAEGGEEARARELVDARNPRSEKKRLRVSCVAYAP